jgi:uncharacterized protein
VLDVVRGVALFGVLAVNTLTLFRVSVFEQFLPLPRRPPPLLFSAALHPVTDPLIGRAITIGLEMKAFILLSLLFGTGLAAQSEHVRGRGGSFARIASRRLGMLLVIGLIHLVLVWNGDVLTLYALVGAIAAPLIARLSSRALLGVAALLFVVQVSPLPYPAPFISVDALEAHVDAARHIYAFGSFGQVLAFRIVELRPIVALLVWCVPRTLGLFLLGAVVWRTKIFRERRAKSAFLRASAGLALGGLAMWVVHSDAGITETALVHRWHGVIQSWGEVLLSLGYGSMIVVLYNAKAPLLTRVLSAFAPLGRMALTTYLVQSIVLGWIFYGYGLGLFGALGETSALAIVLVIFVVQTIVARVWLSRFRYGPMEWAWRSFTYGEREPFAAPSR